MQESLPTDSSWCGQLYEEQAANLILYARSLGLSHSEAEDALQEVFECLLRLRSAPERPAHYAVRAIRNRALNLKRGFLRRVLRELESRRWFEPSPGEAPQEQRAMKCLTQLPPEQREVIVLKLWNGHTFDEIGELLSISPNTAAGRYRYGIQRIRNHLNEGLYEREELLGRVDGFVDTTAPCRRA